MNTPLIWPRIGSRSWPEERRIPSAGEAEGEERSAIIGELVGESDVMRGVRRDIEIAAGLDLNVLITGEPGTGKELVAKGIHNASNRAKKSFVDVNVAALNSSLIESELFGHEKGLYRGSYSQDRPL